MTGTVAGWRVSVHTAQVLAGGGMTGKMSTGSKRVGRWSVSGEGEIPACAGMTGLGGGMAGCSLVGGYRAADAGLRRDDGFRGGMAGKCPYGAGSGLRRNDGDGGGMAAE